MEKQGGGAGNATHEKGECSSKSTKVATHVTWQQHTLRGVLRARAAGPRDRLPPRAPPGSSIR
eukprot:1789977-Rhodomonas_salina.1